MSPAPRLLAQTTGQRACPVGEIFAIRAFCGGRFFRKSVAIKITFIGRASIVIVLSRACPKPQHFDFSRDRGEFFPFIRRQSGGGRPNLRQALHDLTRQCLLLIQE